MAINRKANPTGVDKQVDKLQVALFNKLTTKGWTNYESYHRAYKNDKDDNLNPEIFESDNNYKVSLFNDDYSATSFFIVNNIRPVNQGMVSATISVIFQADLRKTFTTSPNTSRFDEELINDVSTIVNGLSGSYQFSEIATTIDDVYVGFNTDKIKQTDIGKRNVARFDIEVIYKPDCNDTYATSACTIGTTVSTTAETSLGADDGTATADYTGDQGTLSYLWTTNDGVIPSGEEIKETATGLSPGTYTVVVTDDNTTNCTASSFGTVDAGTPAPTCNMLIDSVTVVRPSTISGTDGSATVSVSNNVGVVNYVWSDNQTASTATGLSTGDFSSAISDSGVGATCFKTSPANIPSTNSLTFDGSNDYISFTAETGSSIISLSFWTLANLITFRRVIGGTGGNYIRLNSGSLGFRAQGLSDISFAFSNSIMYEKKTHFLITSDGAEVRVYADGVESTTGAIPYIVPSFDVKQIGRYDSGGYFSGVIKEVIWQNGLVATAANAVSLYNSGNSSDPELIFTSPTGYHKLNGEGTDTTSPDDSANTNNGTLNGFPASGMWNPW